MPNPDPKRNPSPGGLGRVLLFRRSAFSGVEVGVDQCGHSVALLEVDVRVGVRVRVRVRARVRVRVRGRVRVRVMVKVRGRGEGRVRA